jgi:hypothetical protein
MINVVVVAILAAAIGVLTNYATASVPTWFQDQVRVWLVFALAVMTAVVIQLVAAREKSTPVQLPPVRARLSVAPVALRRPTSDVATVRGRDGELARIMSMVADPCGRFVVICGPGGMGKTTMAARAAEHAESLGQAVFWIRWRDEESLTAQMIEVAITLGLPPGEVGAAQESGGSILDLVWGQLTAVGGWVVVLDNIDRPLDVSPTGEPVWEHRGWIRPGGAGLLVVTSRDRSPGTWGRGAELVGLGPLEGHDGAQVLLDLAPDGGSQEAAEGLARRLGGLPLALHAAGTALALPTARLGTFQAYQDALADRSAEVLPERPDVTDPALARALVGYTWELSLDQLNAEGKPLARLLLRSLAMLAEAPVPIGIVGPGLIPKTEFDGVSQAAVDGALAGLEQYSLVDAPSLDRTFRIRTVVLHPLVRETTILLARQAGYDDAWAHTVEDHLIDESALYVSQGRTAWLMNRLLAPHMATLPGLSSADITRFYSARNAVDNIADEFRRAGDAAVEIILRQTVLDAEIKVLGPDHPDTLKSQNNLALTLDSLGRHNEAEELHRRTLDTRTRTLDPDHPNTLQSQNNLAKVQLRGKHARWDRILTWVRNKFWTR